eukprot:COSAG04_NODE_2419_length_4162_cov_3.588481_3_plen_186_part_00
MGSAGAVGTMMCASPAISWPPRARAMCSMAACSRCRPSTACTHQAHSSRQYTALIAQPSEPVFFECQFGFRTCCSVTRGTQKAPPTPLAAAAAASAACLASDRVVVHLAAADSAARLSCEQTDDVRRSFRCGRTRLFFAYHAADHLTVPIDGNAKAERDQSDVREQMARDRAAGSLRRCPCSSRG